MSKEVSPDKPLTDNERIFALEWLKDRNGSRAYKFAYKSCKSDGTAKTNASKKLSKANVRAFIKKRLKKLEEKLEISAERVLQEYAKIAFVDPTIFYDENDNLKPLSKLPKHAAAAISEFSQFFVGPHQRIKKIKLVPKDKALQALAEYLNLFKSGDDEPGGGKGVHIQVLINNKETKK